jgi:hypothetical protein
LQKFWPKFAHHAEMRGFSDHLRWEIVLQISFFASFLFTYLPIFFHFAQ